MSYLNKIGVQVHKVTELQAGDIVGYALNTYGYEEIRILCVEQVVPKPCYVKWFGPHSPYVSFKVPHVGFTVKDDKEGRIHIITNPPSNPYKYKWSEMPLQEALKEGWGSKENREFLNVEDECFDLYLITSEPHKRLGRLIPEIEVPWWSALAQTMNGHEPIIEFVERTREYFKQAKELHKKIEEEVRRTV